MLNCDTARFDGKNIALIYVGDNSGCSHVRLRYNAMYFDGIDTGVIPIVMPVFTFDPNILAHCKSIVFQRPVSPTHVEIVKRYKALQPKYGYKMVFELDDLIFKTGLGPADKEDGIPSYNMSSQRINRSLLSRKLVSIRIHLTSQNHAHNDGQQNTYNAAQNGQPNIFTHTTAPPLIFTEICCTARHRISKIISKLILELAGPNLRCIIIFNIRHLKVLF